MIRFGQCVALSALGLVLWSSVALGQTKDTASTLTNATSATVSRNTSGRILLPEATTAGPVDPVNPALNFRSERSLPPEVREQLRKFEAARQAYLNEQERLRKLFKGSTEQERQIIRDRIKQLHDRWQEQAQKFRDQARERQKELKRALPKHREALNEARPGLRGRQPAGLD